MQIIQHIYCIYRNK